MGAAPLVTAQQLSSPPGGDRPASGSPAADSGKAAIVPPAARAPGQEESEKCVPALPCGTRLLGAVRRNGAVELQVPALRW
jgi:hypothetical protein